MNRRVRLGIGAVSALLLGGALVAPIVLRDSGSSRDCSMTLTYAGSQYVVHPIRDNSLVQAVAIGVGVTHGCGYRPQNVNLRSLLGVSPAKAVALAGDVTSVYVRRGVCAHTTTGALRACLTR
ncbi:MAG TPA: hypothetical protein VHS09_03645 [Polyangiaceae bacterium]|nr:hypothetical protein [Polyangiaceae bacterium]